jgi:hypothetical protein
MDAALRCRKGKKMPIPGEWAWVAIQGWTALFEYLIESAHDLGERGIHQRVIDLRPLPSALEISLGFQVFQLLGNIGLLRAQDLLDLADALFSVRQNAENLKPRGVGYDLQERDYLFAFFNALLCQFAHCIPP